MITLYTNLDSDVRTPTGRKIRGYPLNFPATFVTKAFSVEVTGPCVESDYTADRKAIPPLTPVTDTNLIKYVLAVDGVQHYPFGFTFTPNSCGFFKEYTLHVKTYPENTDVASFPWITVDQGQDTQGTPNTVAQLTINSNDPSIERYYIVTVKSKLYATSTFWPEFSFKVYLHVSPCLRSVLTWGTRVP
jgi:hypothetical protein